MAFIHLSIIYETTIGTGLKLPLPIDNYSLTPTVCTIFTTKIAIIFFSSQNFYSPEQSLGQFSLVSPRFGSQRVLPQIPGLATSFP